MTGKSVDLIWTLLAFLIGPKRLNPEALGDGLSTHSEADMDIRVWGYPLIARVLRGMYLDVDVHGLTHRERQIKRRSLRLPEMADICTSTHTEDHITFPPFIPRRGRLFLEQRS